MSKLKETFKELSASLFILLEKRMLQKAISHNKNYLWDILMWYILI